MRVSTRTRWLLIAAGITVWATLLVVAIAGPVRAATPPFPPAVVATKADPDQTGVRSSAYTGRYYRAVDENYRRCIAQREGRGQYWITGRNGFYQGTYQMTPALVRGAAWMMTAELRAMWPTHWRVVRDTLLDTPGHLWSRFYADMAFWTVLGWNGPRSGAHHWAGGRFTCTPGMTHSVGNR